MARKATGSIVVHEGKDRLTYRSLRFTAYGKRRYLPLGPVSCGEAERALRHVLADVERGTWQPAAQTPDPAEAEPTPTFHVFAEQWWLEHEHEWESTTQADCRWRLERHLLSFFGALQVDAITQRSSIATRPRSSLRTSESRHAAAR